MLTAAADEFRLQRLAASVAEFGIVGKLSLAIRALHQECPPTELQSMTAA
jgi:hypothetical protein